MVEVYNTLFKHIQKDRSEIVDKYTQEFVRLDTTLFDEEDTNKLQLTVEEERMKVTVQNFNEKNKRKDEEQPGGMTRGQLEERKAELEKRLQS